MSQSQVVTKATRRKALIASLIGSTIEWYDYLIYGTVASLVFNKLFFPNFDPIIGILLAYASFGIPFFIRPFGGAIFSHIGDKIGRKKTLVLTLSIMGLATMLIGLLPDYNTIGIWAPILLVLLRVVQGFGIGGEWGGALLLAVEYSSKENRGLFGSIPQMGVPLGMLLGTLSISLISFLSEEQFLEWGWRIPFILSAVLVFVGLWIRNGVDETPAFQLAKESGNIAKLPIIDTFKYHWKSVVITIGIKFVESAPFYIFTVFVISYGTKNLNFDKVTILNAITIGTILAALVIPLAGTLSDRVGRKLLFIYGTIAMILFSFPYFFLLSLESSLWIIVATSIGLCIYGVLAAVMGTLFSEIFSTTVRYTGVTMGYQIGGALAGGTAPLIATTLLSIYNNSWIPIAIYIFLVGIISLVSIMLVRETKDTNFSESVIELSPTTQNKIKM
ncbi:MFS transporter [Peribacillus simplex]|uniref:MFS transporter n=1 Tax=Peribacillus simplex TaxID=1478 RepID=UPI00366E6673